MTNWPRDALIGLYLAVQVALPLRGLWYEPFATRGNFSWNMYSRRYQCSVAYVERDARGTIRRIPHERLFHLPSFATRVYNRSRLPRFHAWLCERPTRTVELAQIVASGTCRLNGGPWVEMIRPNVDLCTAPNHGVLPE